MPSSRRAWPKTPTGAMPPPGSWPAPPAPPSRPLRRFLNRRPSPSLGRPPSRPRDRRRPHRPRPTRRQPHKSQRLPPPAAPPCQLLRRFARHRQRSRRPPLHAGGAVRPSSCPRLCSSCWSPSPRSLRESPRNMRFSTALRSSCPSPASPFHRGGGQHRRRRLRHRLKPESGAPASARCHRRIYTALHRPHPRRRPRGGGRRRRRRLRVRR